jgi:hypothetical protein
MIRITKIFDYDCPICEHMLTFDGNVIFNLGLQTHYGAVELGTLSNSTEPWNAHVYFLLENHVVSSNYTIDLPVYLVTEGTTYLGHTTGELTQAELRAKLEEVISSAKDKESSAPQSV